MRLISIIAKNYRTLQDTELKFSKSYCTISGKNNAGKSYVIRLLSSLFYKRSSAPWSFDDPAIDYKEDKTQWVKGDRPIEIEYKIELTKDDDPALISFVEKISSAKTSLNNVVEIAIKYEIIEENKIIVSTSIDGKMADDMPSKEIDKKIKDSNLLFLYNSTIQHEEYYYRSGRRLMFYEFAMSEEEKKELDKASKQLEIRSRRLVREHKESLNAILGRLSERYGVEFSPMEGYVSRRMPLGINLRDRLVEVPLNNWGSGTQNKTRILMSLLQANRIKTTVPPDDKITPIVVIEEPESFLHPSAQSEFGTILGKLSAELGIQLIVTTHSPYMLNRDEPSSNILLCRRSKRKRLYETYVVDASGDNWMAPFAEHLGIPSEEFLSWRPVFSGYKSKVLLVEGPIDKEYFEFFQKNDLPAESLAKDIEVVPYGGKDTLKNTLLLKFVLSKFDKVFITYDLDAETTARATLERLGLKDLRDFMPLGLNQSGRKSIEGLLPDRILSIVNGRETDLVMGLSSNDNSERRAAKEQLKKKFLVEFKSHSDYKSEELETLSKVIKTINKNFARGEN